jgi:hypothetical protein
VLVGKSRKSRKSLKELQGAKVSFTENKFIYTREGPFERLGNEEALPKPKTNISQSYDLTNVKIEGFDFADDGLELVRNDLELSTRKMTRN